MNTLKNLSNASTIDNLSSTDLKEEILIGLQKSKKELPCKLFYDEKGSMLFDQICKLEEYYPTRTEASIMEDNIDEIISHIGEQSLLLEYGSGSSQKTRILLDNLPKLSGYIPIDISKEHLLKNSLDLKQEYPHVDVYPVCADYHKPFELPEVTKEVEKKIAFFPGSTIGNFHPHEAVTFLQGMASAVENNGGIIIGVDLKKDHQILEQAYDDSKGVTADFNLNSLVRVNEELGANISVDRFKHTAFYNRDKGRVEMHLISLEPQTYQLDGINIDFKEGESIWTESSYKYTLEEFEEIARDAGLKVSKVWTDNNNLFSVQYLSVV